MRAAPLACGAGRAPREAHGRPAQDAVRAEPARARPATDRGIDAQVVLLVAPPWAQALGAEAQQAPVELLATKLNCT